MPSVLGRKSAASPLWGFIQTIRWLSRDSRSIAVGQHAGSPRSRPSEQITTMPPAAQPRRPQSRTNVSSESPIRVPPSQSKTALAAWSNASSGRRRTSFG